jgi:two-component system, cell cycle response regulator
MALRVLLADESSTIKKVFQLALQDFAVEVRPIVLMWSGFVELDEDKFQASHANAQLEKPFDVAALRKLITDLVPRTQSQSLSQYLTFPKGQAEAPQVDFQEKPEGAGEDFMQVPIPKIKGKNDSTEKYRLNMKPEDLDPANIPVEFNAPGDSEVIELSQVVKDEDRETDEFQMREAKKPVNAPPPLPKAPAAPKGPPKMEEADLEIADEVSAFVPAPSVTIPAIPGGGLTAEQLEKIIRDQSKDVIESVVWKVVPELATQIIERELNRLLKERDSHPY